MRVHEPPCCENPLSTYTSRDNMCEIYNPDLGRGIIDNSRPGAFGPAGIADNAPAVPIVYFTHVT